MAANFPGSLPSATPATHGAVIDEIVAIATELTRWKVVYARRTAGSVTVNSSAAWVNVDTGIDLVLPAVAGDLVEVSVSGLWTNEATHSYLDAVSVVSGAPVNSWAIDGAVVTNPATVTGVTAWWGISGETHPFGGSVSRRLVAGDLSGGNVTLRLRAATAAATAKTLLAIPGQPLLWSAKNFGPF